MRSGVRDRGRFSVSSILKKQPERHVLRLYLFSRSAF